MATDKDEKRAALKARLIDAAEQEIAAHGLAGLKVRTVTAKAGCALGALYNVVEDLDLLIFHVNSRTLKQLGQALQAALTKSGQDPRNSLQALAATYASFAMEKRNLWLALFEHRPSAGRTVPDWHRMDHAVLLQEIAPYLAQLRPDLDPAALELRARTTFAAVHGIVLLALEGRFVGVPLDALRSEIAGLVETLSLGAQAQAQR
ncbi:TetR/AcrR family transcriptional regulator [Paracoccus sp. (in: a-proteobacteria)]|uniref:TetR/AcrR family transcriptional regulator n=1 Tax=Paracoccus sp. TaxID=267 RepID=UPI003A8B78A3